VTRVFLGSAVVLLCGTTLLAQTPCPWSGLTAVPAGFADGVDVVDASGTMWTLTVWRRSLTPIIIGGWSRIRRPATGRRSPAAAPSPRLRTRRGPGTDVPELTNGQFGALITSDQPIAVERALYWDANGQIWAAGTNATGTRLP
jgi:hypothetical protein